MSSYLLPAAADFTWISTICTAPMVLLVKPDFPARKASEAFDVLRSEPSARSTTELGAGFNPAYRRGNVETRAWQESRSQHIPYRGGAAAVLSVAKGETVWGVASLGSAAGQMQGNLVRPLAITSAERFPSFPGFPTFAELGLQDMELNIFYFLHGPASLPADITTRLHRASVASLMHPQTRDRFVAAGMQAWDGQNTPLSTRGIVETEIERFKSIGERTGIKITRG